MSDPTPHLRVLSTLARALASAGEPSTVYHAIAECAVTSLGATAARVWISAPGAATLRAAGSHGFAAETERDLLDAVTLPAGAGVPGAIFATRIPEFLEDARDDPRWVNGRYIRTLGIRAYIGLPLVAADLVVGVLSILFGARRTFEDAERTLAGILADYSAIAVRIAQLSDERRRAETLAAVIHLANATAHELNNPLAVVVGQAELLARHVSDRPEGLARVVRIQEASRRLADVVARMNRVARLEMHDALSGDLPPMLDLRRSSDP